MPEQTADLKTKYSLESQAATLFSFLKDTFLKMPRSVQVIGWIVLLLLFVFLVLYPLIGITYYHGRVVTLKRDSENRAVMEPERGLRIYKEHTAITNEEGEFTVWVRIPSVPFMGVEFDFGTGPSKETVVLPTPIPLVSMFNPNTRKIFYVPASGATDELGIVKRFFLDVGEARKAFLKSNAPSRVYPPSVNSQPQVGILARLRNSGTAYAAEQSYREQTFTLRLRELKVSSDSNASEVYFEILVDGAPVRTSAIPNASSKHADRLTVFPDVPFKLQDLDIPLPKVPGRVDVRVLSPGLLRDVELASFDFRLAPDDVGKAMKQSSNKLEILVELMPPVALRFQSQPLKDGSYIAVMWLDTTKDHLKRVAALYYEDASGARTGAPEIERSNYFRNAYRAFQPERFRASVTFSSGSVLRLATFLTPNRAELKSSMDFIARASLASTVHDELQALALIDKAINLDPDFAYAYSTKSAILSTLGKFEEAARMLDQAIAKDPQSATLLNSYAWLVADKLPRPTEAQLSRARIYAEQASKTTPDPNHLDTLAWVLFKQGDYARALAVLDAGLATQRKLDKGSSSSVWLEMTYHRARVYLKLGRKEEAQRAFQEVLQYTKTYGLYMEMIERYDADARVQLSQLRR